MDISSASVKNIIIKRPDNSKISGSAIFTTDGTDGQMYYRTLSTDLNQSGNYLVQAYLVLSNFTGYTSPTGFSVTANL